MYPSGVFKMKLLLAVLFVTTAAFAAGEKGVVSEIENSNIVCSNSMGNLDVHVNTTKGKVWFKDTTKAGNLANEAYGPVFSGVYSSVKYFGEILGEVEWQGKPMYFTLIFRERRGKPELETNMYHVKYQDEVVTYFSSNCQFR
jgi:hypothetical protein